MFVLINYATIPPPDLPGRFAFLIAALLRACGAHITKDRTAGPWLILVCNRMNGISQRIQRLAAQIQAGTVPPLRAGFKLTKPRKPRTKPPIVLPNNPMWLIQVIQPTAVYGVWLQQMLADPQMPALLAAAPQLARILRPLCRALGVTPPPLPPRPQRPAPPDPAPSDQAPRDQAPCDPPPPDPAAPVATQPDPPPAPAGRPAPAPPRRALAPPARPRPGVAPPGQALKSA